MAVPDVPEELILNERTSYDQYLWLLPGVVYYRWDSRVQYMYGVGAFPVEGQGLPLHPPVPPIDSPFNNGQNDFLFTTFLPSSSSIYAGDGLTGGGVLNSNPSIRLSDATKALLAKGGSSVQKVNNTAPDANGNITISTSEAGYDIIILAGQSNMAGRGLPFSSATDPVNPRIFQYRNTIQPATEPLLMPDNAQGMGPGLQFARWYTARKLATGRNVLLVPQAVGGTPLSSNATLGWRRGVANNLYAAMLTQTQNALSLAGAGSRIVAVLWLQGETDGDAQISGEQYRSDFDALINGVRSDLNISDLPFIVGTMVPEYLSTGTRVQINAMHRDTPNRIARTDVAVSAVGMNANDGNHFNGPGQRFNGKAFYDAYERVVAGLMPYSEVAVPAAPVVTLGTVASTTVALSWKAVNGATSYAVAYRIAGGTWLNAPTVTITTTTVKGLSSSTAYEFRVAALSAAGYYSDVSNIVAATTTSASFVVLGVAGASQAYSLRKVADSSYTGSAVRVRRSSDNATQDIGFTSGTLDTAALLSFAGSGDAYVSTWYDQSGNGQNINQVTAAAQPKLVNAGAVIMSGGKPAVSFDGVDDCLLNSSPVLFASGSATVLQVLSSSTPTGAARTWTETVSSANNQYGLMQPDAADSRSFPVMTGAFSFSTITPAPSLAFFNGSIHQGSSIDTGSAISQWVDGAADTINSFTYGRVTAPYNTFTLGGATRSGSLAAKAMTFSEMVTFPSALSTANRQTAEANQKAFFGTP